MYVNDVMRYAQLDKVLFMDSTSSTPCQIHTY